jgi:hypothetical protein
MRHGFTVMTMKSNEIFTLEVPCFALPLVTMTGMLFQVKVMLLVFLFLIIEILCIMDSHLKVRQLIRIFICQFWDISRMQYKENDLKCGLQEASSSIMMCLLT